MKLDGGLTSDLTQVPERARTLEVEIAEGVKVRVTKAAILQVVSKTEPAGEPKSAKS